MSGFPDPDNPLIAQCACGALTVTVTGAPRTMLHCACRDCQKATGTGHQPFFAVRDSDLTIVGPTTDWAVTSDSGATMTRKFCPVCGTRISAHSSRWTDTTLLPAGLFGEGADWFAPRAVIFARSLMDWDEIDAKLPRYDTYRG